MGKRNTVKINRITMVEALVALFVMAMVAMAMISLTTFSSEISGLMDRRQICLQLAVRRVEEIRNRPFSEVDLFGEDNVRIGTSGQADADGEYWRTTVISNMADDSCHVTVNVASLGGFMRKPTHYQLSTAVIDYDKIDGQPE